MGKDSELFKAAQTGNNVLLERVFASHLKKQSGQGGGHGFGSVRVKSHPNIQDDAGYTLLHHATLQSQRDTVNLLLRCGASTTISDNSGSCPLHLAAWKGDLEIVKMLVTQGPSRANVNQQSDSEDSALHLASQYGFSEVVEFLLQRHADPLLLNAKGETALDLAAQYGHIDSVHLLISHCPEMLYLQRPQFSPLHLAARNGHTVVALSLINAGISVNTVCDRGSALHEAAMCGKDETVELLLDKGVNLELRDSKGQTVFDVLDEYTADKAVKIKAMIHDHNTGARQSSSPQPPPPKHQNIVAVSQTNCLTVVEDSNALAFKRGDTIIVKEKRGDGLFIGTCHNKTGSFLAEDVVFYTERNGELVLTDISSLSSGTRIRTEKSLSDGVMKLAISTKDPYEHIPGFPVSTSPELVPIATTSATPSNTDVSVSTSIDESESRSSIASLTDSNHLSVASRARADKKRLSKKDKKFQLSKDTGAYSELSPINPVEAKKEFGDTLKLNPVGPAFSGVAEESQVVTAHNSEPERESRESQFQGSYYVLEVGNFDRESRTQISPPHEVRESRTQISPPHEVSPPVEQATGTADNESLQPGYYMLDLNNFDPKEISKTDTTKEQRTSQRLSQYENINDLRGYDSPKNVATHLDNHSRLSEPIGSQVSPLISSTQSDTSTVRVQSPPAPKVEPAYGNINRGSAPPAYENILVLSQEEHPPPLPKKIRSKTPSETILPIVTDDEKRSSLKRRNMVYEVTSIGGGGEKQKNSSNNSSPTECTSPIAIPTSSLSSDGDHSDPASVESKPTESMSLTRISTSVDPFAGLVMSASTQLEESLSLSSSTNILSGGEPEELSNGVFRGRTETVWDNERVELEWSQIDTLLRDMTGSIGQSQDTPPATPILETLPSWLSTHGLGGCVSALETHGFDSLSYLGGNILVMDDLEDVGILAQDDQYNLMAAASLLPPPPRVGRVESVSEWLELLQLSHLQSKFDPYTLERLSSLWEVELAAVVGIEELGYRKRLQYGIAELRSAHPEWMKNSSPKHSKVSQTLPPASTPMDGVSFTKDYSKLRSTLPTNTEIEVRPPSVAQTIQVGKGHRMTKLPSSTWKHPNSALITDSICYKTKYLGSVIIKNLHGKQSAEEACLRLKSSTETMQKKPDIILSISWKGVKFVDGHTKVVVSTHAIRDISCCSPDIEDKRVFAYITKDKLSGKHYSHVFMASSQETADEIKMTIAQAFEICYQKVMKVRSKVSSPSLNRPPSRTNQSSTTDSVQGTS